MEVGSQNQQPSGKIFVNISQLPELPGHEDHMVRCDRELGPRWEEIKDDVRALSKAHEELAERIDLFLQREGLLDDVSGIVSSVSAMVWVKCSARAWERMETELGLEEWPNIKFEPFLG